MKATIDTLVISYGLGDATEVMLSGCSAGGLAAFIHSDFIGDYLRGHSKSLTKYKTVPGSGFFAIHDNLVGDPEYAKRVEYFHEMQ